LNVYSLTTIIFIPSLCLFIKYEPSDKALPTLHFIAIAQVEILYLEMRKPINEGSKVYSWKNDEYAVHITNIGMNW